METGIRFSPLVGKCNRYCKAEQAAETSGKEQLELVSSGYFTSPLSSQFHFDILGEIMVCRFLKATPEGLDSLFIITISSSVTCGPDLSIRTIDCI